MQLDVAECEVGEVSGLDIRRLRSRGRQASILYDCSNACRILLALKRFTSVQCSGKGRVMIAEDKGVRILCLTRTLWSSMSETGLGVSKSSRRETAASLAFAGVEISEM